MTPAQMKKHRAEYVKQLGILLTKQLIEGRSSKQLIDKCVGLDNSGVAHRRLAAKVKAKQDDANRVR